jgi:hypothetical protein
MRKQGTLFMVCLAVWSAAAQIPQKDMVELHIRNGLPNFMNKVSSGSPVKIGYFGGSITEDNDGWRTRSLAWFKSHYNNNNITGYNASIGGTDSKYGVFRIDEHLLDKDNFDLIFIEFAVNDLNNESSEIDECFEGLIRKIWKKNPNTDICLVHMLRDGDMLNSVINGKMPVTSTIQDNVAEYYQIPSLFVGLQVIGEMNAGTLVFTDAITNHQESRNSSGQRVFAEDGVHPSLYGYELCTKVVSRCFEQMEDRHTPGSHILPEAMNAGNYELAGMHPYDVASNHGFEVVTAKGIYPFLDAFVDAGNAYLISEDPAAYYSFSFTGSIVGFSYIQGPGTGFAKVEIDGTPRNLYLFDGYSHEYRRSFFFFQTGPGKHRVKIYPASPVSLDEKRDILIDAYKKALDQNPGAYLHNYTTFNRIMILGTLEGENPTDLVSVSEPEPVTYQRYPDHLSFRVSESLIGSQLTLYDLMGRLLWQGCFESENLDISPTVPAILIGLVRTVDQKKTLSIKIPF